MANGAFLVLLTWQDFALEDQLTFGLADRGVLILTLSIVLLGTGLLPITEQLFRPLRTTSY